jgi:hypothetical protein
MPFDKVPTGGVMDQFTAVLLDPVTVAFSVVVCPLVSKAVEGVTTIETGAVSEIIALALLVLSAELVAVTVTDWAIVTNAGAV